MSSASNVTDQVMKHIKEKIITGTWTVGSKIPSENEFCRNLGCSRTSVRCAIQRYNELGVLETFHGKGTFVKSLEPFAPPEGLFTDLLGNKRDRASMKNFVKWRQVRSILEPQIIYEVAQNATTELVNRLRQINKEQFDAIGNQALFIEKDIEFHMAIVKFLDNEYLNRIMEYIFAIPGMMVFGNEEFGYSGGGYFHMMLTDAVAQHDADRARELMKEHQAELSRMNLLMGKPKINESSEKDM